ncbi:MAG: type II secretion system protein GspM [Gammaproteobacteria bacterium]|nr:type II secretion system protein GspM [Gammaproteobacteria bacterium]
MITQLPRWQHCTVSLLLLGLLVALIYVALVLPALSSRQKLNDRVEDLEFQVERFKDTENQIALLQKQQITLKKNYPNKEYFLPEKSQALAAADLQTQIKVLVESNGGELVSTHAIESQDSELHRKVTIKVLMQSDMETLQKVFYELAVNRPLLFTDNIMIQKRRRTTGRQERDAAHLQVRFDVTGYIYQSQG